MTDATFSLKERNIHLSLALAHVSVNMLNSRWENNTL